MSELKKIKRGEYLYKNGDVEKIIRKDFYMGGWNVWSSVAGCPAFAKGFQNKKDAVKFLDDHFEE